MAEIDIERKPRQSGWPWAIAVVLLLMVVGAAWYFTGGGFDRGARPDVFQDSAAAPEGPAPPGTNRP